MQRASLPTAVRQVADREVRVVVSSGEGGRDGIVLDCAGCDLSQYRKNPVVLLGHDPMMPVARCSRINANGIALHGTIKFPSAGVSQVADNTYSLVREGILNSVSVGYEPLSPPTAKDRAGFRTIRQWELLEISWVSIPADKGSTVLERGYGRAARQADLVALRQAARGELGLPRRPVLRDGTDGGAGQWGRRYADFAAARLGMRRPWG
jgi:HK97 family phage prohead protease